MSKPKIGISMANPVNVLFFMHKDRAVPDVQTLLTAKQEAFRKNLITATQFFRERNARAAVAPAIPQQPVIIQNPANQPELRAKIQERNALKGMRKNTITKCGLTGTAIGAAAGATIVGLVTKSVKGAAIGAGGGGIIGGGIGCIIGHTTTQNLKNQIEELENQIIDALAAAENPALGPQPVNQNEQNEANRIAGSEAFKRWQNGQIIADIYSIWAETLGANPLRLGPNEKLSFSQNQKARIAREIEKCNAQQAELNHELIKLQEEIQRLLLSQEIQDKIQQTERNINECRNRLEQLDIEAGFNIVGRIDGPLPAEEAQEVNMRLKMLQIQLQHAHEEQLRIGAPQPEQLHINEQTKKARLAQQEALIKTLNRLRTCDAFLQVGNKLRLDHPDGPEFFEFIRNMKAIFNRPAVENLCNEKAALAIQKNKKYAGLTKNNMDPGTADEQVLNEVEALKIRVHHLPKWMLDQHQQMPRQQ